MSLSVLAFALAAGLPACLTTAAVAQTISWASPVDGDWNDAANWSPMNVPDAVTEDAVIDVAGNYTVRISGTQTIGALALDNPDAMLLARPGARLNISLDSTNNGEIQIHEFGGALNSAILTFIDDVSLNGNGLVILAAPPGPLFRAQLNAADGVTATIGSQQTVRGRGSMSGNFANNGTITAGIDEFVELAACAVDLSGGGAIRSDGGTVSFTADTIVRDGTIGAGSGGGRVQSGGVSFFDNVTVDTVFTVVPQGRQQIISGGLINNGEIRIHDTPGDGNSAMLNFAEDATLFGAGSIVLRVPTVGGLFRAQLTTTEGVTATVGPDQIIEGNGSILASLTLNGMITARSNDFVSIEESTIDLSGGGVVRSDGGTVSFAANTLVRDGTIGMGPGGGRVQSGGVSFFDNVTVDTVFTVAPQGRQQINAGGLINNGEIRIHDTPGNANFAVLNFAEETSIAGTGTIFLGGQAAGGFRARLTATTGISGTLESGQTLSGDGVVEGAITIRGMLAPGDDGVGGIGIESEPVTLVGSTTTVMEIADTGSANHDQLLVVDNGSIILDGTIALDFINGYVPQIGDEFVLITSSSGGISGEFDTITIPGDPQRIRITYEPNQFKIGYTCKPDINGDFIINNSDINAFISGFLNEGRLADINNDGFWNATDINLFVQLFLGGCV